MVGAVIARFIICISGRNLPEHPAPCEVCRYPVRDKTDLSPAPGACVSMCARVRPSRGVPVLDLIPVRVPVRRVHKKQIIRFGRSAFDILYEVAHVVYVCAAGGLILRTCKNIRPGRPVSEMVRKQNLSLCVLIPYPEKRLAPALQCVRQRGECDSVIGLIETACADLDQPGLVISSGALLAHIPEEIRLNVHYDDFPCRNVIIDILHQ